MSGELVRSAPKEERAAELVEFLCDPAVAAVVPPFGGELAIDLLDQLDWDRLAVAEPTWLVGWSDISSLLVPLTTRLDWASAHGWNLMDTALAAPEGLLHWTDLLAATGDVVQRSPGRTRQGSGNWLAPDTVAMTLDQPTDWVVLGGGDADVSGRLIGGCLEVLAPLAGTPYADVPAYGRAHADEGLLVYLEVCEYGAYDVCRLLHGLRYADWFDTRDARPHRSHAGTGRRDLTRWRRWRRCWETSASRWSPTMDIGHTQPFLPLVNGASARVVVRDGIREVTQRIG